MQKFLFIAATLALTAYGQIALKARASVLGVGREGDRIGYLFAMFTDPVVISGLMAAVLAAMAWTLAIQQAAISAAYPYMALSFVIVPLAGMLILGEPVMPRQWIGIALIVAGIAVAIVPR